MDGLDQAQPQELHHDASHLKTDNNIGVCCIEGTSHICNITTSEMNNQGGFMNSQGVGLARSKIRPQILQAHTMEIGIHIIR